MTKPALSSAVERHAEHRRRRLLLWFILAPGAALRLTYLTQLSGSPFFGLPRCDEDVYHRMALAIAHGDFVGNGRPYWNEPLYAHLIGAMYALFGANPGRALLLNVVLDAISCTLTYSLGRRLFGARVGLAAAAALAGYRTSIFLSGQLLASSLATCLVLAALVLLMKLLEKPTLGLAVALGAALGLGALAKGTGLALAAAVVGLLMFRQRRLAAITGCVTLTLIGLATTRNFLVSREIVLVSSNAGVNLWLGNNPDFDRLSTMRPGPAWKEMIEEPVEAGVRGDDAQSAYFVRRVLDFAWHHPVDELRLLGRKASHLVWGAEIPRNQQIYPMRAYSGVLRALLWKHGLAFPAGVAIPFGLVGLGVALRTRRPGLLAPGLALGSYGCAIVLVFVTARYRMPLIPVFLVFAAFLGREVIRLARARAFGRGLRLACAALLAIILCNVHVGPMPVRFDADTYQAAALHHQRAGRLAQADALYREALMSQPNFLPALEGVAMVHWLRREIPQAQAAFERALMIARERDLLEAAATFFAEQSDIACARALRAEIRPKSDRRPRLQSAPSARALDAAAARRPSEPPTRVERAPTPDASDQPTSDPRGAPATRSAPRRVTRTLRTGRRRAGREHA
jgi:4-amino-4-deoxy-L-arabinose transferase-like glycosyltransferase